MGNRYLLFRSVRPLPPECAVARAAACGFRGNLRSVILTDQLAGDENPFSLACERKGNPGGTLAEIAKRDLERILPLYRGEEAAEPDFERKARGGRDADPLPGVEALDFDPGALEGTVYSPSVRDRILALNERLENSADAEEMLDALACFYQTVGVGDFGLHKAFCIAEGRQLWQGMHPEPFGEERPLPPHFGGYPGSAFAVPPGTSGDGFRIEPISNIAPVHLSDLVGLEAAKKKLTDNTDAFVAGRKANNVLLFGDAGTGKSTSIKAIANKYYDRGLRVVEVYKHQLRLLPELIRTLKGRSYRFVIFLDDLSFEDSETEYKYLKAVIEGGLEKTPENILIYATSNRRHLIRENYGDKFDGVSEDMNHSDTVQEKLSLAYRFGVTIYFGKPDKRGFQEIVKTLAEREGIAMPEEELLLEANRWELTHGGLTGRTARQFVDYLSGMQ